MLKTVLTAGYGDVRGGKGGTWSLIIIAYEANLLTIRQPDFCMYTYVYICLYVCTWYNNFTLVRKQFTEQK